MNSYASNERRLTARNVAEQALPVIPADLVLSLSQDFNRVFFRENIFNFQPWNINGNFFVKRLGIFANVGDGLVFASPLERFNLDLRMCGYTSVDRGSSCTFAVNSKAIVGTDFLAKLTVGRVLSDNNANPYFVAHITDDNNAELTDYARVASIGHIVEFVEGVPAEISIADVSVLNEMFDCDCFFPVGVNITASMTKVLLSVIMTSSNAAASQVTFLTKSMDTAFAADRAIFDVQADVEFTPV